MDFEEAMASAWWEVFPNCSIIRDFFHLKQANVKKAHKIGLSDFREKIAYDLGIIWYADTKVDFDACLQVFLDKWDEKAPEYTDYFRRVWLGQHSPNTWTAFARPKNAPSGLIFNL